MHGIVPSSLDAATELLHRTGETAADSRILMAGLLADGRNLGLTRMAEACSIASLAQLAWTSDWHIRGETYGLALRRLINQRQREPFAAKFGSGTASSSDGQLGRPRRIGSAAASGRDRRRRRAHDRNASDRRSRTYKPAPRLARCLGSPDDLFKTAR
jgi:hypothetical protein